MERREIDLRSGQDERPAKRDNAKNVSRCCRDCSSDAYTLLGQSPDATRAKRAPCRIRGCDLDPNIVCSQRKATISCFWNDGLLPVPGFIVEGSHPEGKTGWTEHYHDVRGMESA